MDKLLDHYKRIHFSADKNTFIQFSTRPVGISEGKCMQHISPFHGLLNLFQRLLTFLTV